MLPPSKCFSGFVSLLCGIWKCHWNYQQRCTWMLWPPFTFCITRITVFNISIGWGLGNWDWNFSWSYFWNHLCLRLEGPDPRPKRALASWLPGDLSSCSLSQDLFSDLHFCPDQPWVEAHSMVLSECAKEGPQMQKCPRALPYCCQNRGSQSLGKWKEVRKQVQNTLSSLCTVAAPLPSRRGLGWELLCHWDPSTHGAKRRCWEGIKRLLGNSLLGQWLTLCFHHRRAWVQSLVRNWDPACHGGRPKKATHKNRLPQLDVGCLPKPTANIRLNEEGLGIFPWDQGQTWICTLASSVHHWVFILVRKIKARKRNWN